LTYSKDVRFEWDPEKARLNERTHGISFEEAKTIFSADEICLEFYDTEHSTNEDRFIRVGPIARGIVVVVWTERGDGSIRIISVRPATKSERALYEEYMETGE